MDEDVGVQLRDEEQRQRARIGLAETAGLHGAGEVADDDVQPAARGALFVVRVERNDHRGLPRVLMHLHGDGGPDHIHDEGDDLLGEAAQHDARIGVAGRAAELLDVRRHADVGAAHGRGEEGLLRVEVTEDGRGGHAERLRDVGQRSAAEAFLREDGARGVEELLAADAWWTAHVSK